MSIRPVDLQILIPRATDVSKSQQIANQQLASQQQQFAEQWQQISASRQQKVQNTPQTEGGKIHSDTEKEQQSLNKKQGRQQHREKSSGDKDLDMNSNSGGVLLVDPALGHVIDIKT